MYEGLEAGLAVLMTITVTLVVPRLLLLIFVISLNC